MKRFFRHHPGASAGCAIACIAVLALFLGACGDGNTFMPSAAVAPESPAVPVAPVVPAVPVAANAVSVSTPVDGEILAYVGVPSTISLVFRASEGSASGLVLSLPAIPDWRAANDTLHCADVDTAGTCQLQLIYTPTAPAASSSVRLAYVYIDSTGASRAGATTLVYRVLPANTIISSRQPAGALGGIVGRSAAVTLDFATSDGEPAASLRVSSSLTALPAGWNSDRKEFACASVGRGLPCRLMLSYSPMAPAGASGFDLAYSYLDSSGASRSGTARLDYSAIVPGSVTASLDASGPLLAKPGARKEVTVRFVAANGGSASALRLDADPGNASGWSIKPGWQGCATVQGSDSCSLTLVFAPTLVFGPRTLSLPYTYLDNIGETRSGSVEIDYASRLYEAYIADYREDAAGGVRLCTVAVDGRFFDCAAAAIDLPGQGRKISHVLARGRQAYIASLASGVTSSVFLCAIRADGGLAECRETGGLRTGVRRIVLRGASAYLLTGDGKILRQDVDVSTGEIRNCPASRGSCETGVAGMPVTALGFAGSKAYISSPGGSTSNLYVVQCSISPSGDLDCTGPAFYTSQSFFTAGGLATLQGAKGATVYIVGEPYYALLDGSHGVIACSVLADDTIAGCRDNRVATLVYPNTESDFLQDIAFDATHAYIVKPDIIYVCDINPADGTLPNCRSFTGTGASYHLSLSVNPVN